MIQLNLIEDYLLDNEQRMRVPHHMVPQPCDAHLRHSQAQAELYEQTATRHAHRNGYNDGSLKRWPGDITNRKPQILWVSIRNRSILKIYTGQEGIDQHSR
jgi:hypothetical protein